tara:strand:- start:2046 stop:2816 length:771 start_codon:yes stop_codon:yes gene_type:complete
MRTRRYKACFPRGAIAELVIGLTLLVATAYAGEYTGTRTSTKLYTPVDPSAGGGIVAVITAPGGSPLAAIAVAPDNPRKRCYAGNVSGKKISFRGMAPDKYALFILYPDAFYEGITLVRSSRAGVLTSEQREKIDQTLKRAVPFFDVKQIHRIEGASGEFVSARAIVTYLRTGTTGTTMASGFRGDTFSGQLRSIRLVRFEDVGPGFQIAMTRELTRNEIVGDDPKGVLKGRFVRNLSRIRVSDRIKDLGELNLRK